MPTVGGKVGTDMASRQYTPQEMEQAEVRLAGLGLPEDWAHVLQMVWVLAEEQAGYLQRDLDAFATLDPKDADAIFETAQAGYLYTAGASKEYATEEAQDALLDILVAMATETLQEIARTEVEQAWESWAEDADAEEIASQVATMQEHGRGWDDWTDSEEQALEILVGDAEDTDRAYADAIEMLRSWFLEWAERR